MVYGGEYSDWDSVGYFELEEEAKKYCSDKDLYYQKEKMLQLVESEKNKTIYYQHQVVFDYRNNEFKMRNEPERYKYNSIGFHDSSQVKIRNFRKGIAWISFTINAQTRKKAEKIAQDQATKLAALMVESNCTLAFDSMGFKKHNEWSK